MNNTDTRYAAYSIVGEMLDAARVIREFPVEEAKRAAELLQRARVLCTGEGSSRIFPSKKLRWDSLKLGYSESIVSESATQAMHYDLGSWDILAASNSGKTREVVRLLKELQRRQHGCTLSLTASPGTPVEELADHCYLLRSGIEKATAATKSVVEQALFLDVLFRSRNGRKLPDFESLADLFTKVLVSPVPEEIRAAVAGAPVIYWAGLNYGVAEELTLKTNEIARKKSAYLEGTYAVHGIEEVMDPAEVVVVVGSLDGEEEKLDAVLRKGVGMQVISISDGASPFTTFAIPEAGEFTPYLELAAGWSLLIETALTLGVNPDVSLRARKIGNEYTETSEVHHVSD